jgi:hypothetical protein
MLNTIITIILYAACAVGMLATVFALWIVGRIEQ